MNLEPGFPEQLEIPNGLRATYSPDGTRLAYNPLAYVFNQWKHYRGGTHAVISLYKFSDHSVEKIPQPEGGCNDADPMWMGDTVYFRSDRNGEFNLFSFDLKTQTIKPLTQHQDFPVLYASSGDGKIVYEQAGYLHLLDPKKGKGQKITIGVPADLLELRPTIRQRRQVCARRISCLPPVHASSSAFEAKWSHCQPRKETPAT